MHVEKINGPVYPCRMNPFSSQFFKTTHGKCSSRVLVNSIPKSGTYLLAKSLELAGVTDTGVHLRNEFMSDFRGRTLAEIIGNPIQFRVALSLSQSLPMVAKGQFVVGHLEPTEPAIEASAGFAHIFLVRNVVDGLISHMRFTVDPRRTVRATYLDTIADDRERFRLYLERAGKGYFAGMARQLPWKDVQGVLVVRFEELMGDYGVEQQTRCAAGIAEHIGLDTDADLAAAVRAAIGSETRTFAGSRSVATSYVDQHSMEMLEAMGARAHNEALGYGWNMPRG